MIMFKNNLKNRGYTLLELLFYIAIFSIVSLLIIDSMFSMARSFKEASIYAELSQGGAMMEKISREIHQANSVASMSSTSLKLNTKDEEGADKIVEFVLLPFSGPNIEFYEDDVFVANLNSPNIVITDLSFSQITTTHGKAIKVSFSMRSSNDKLSRVQNFYNTIVLRGSY